MSNNKINTGISNNSLLTNNNSNNTYTQAKTTIKEKNDIEEMDFSIESNKLDSMTIANQVLNGKWGNGEERKTRLKEAGYNPEEIQSLVNGIINGTVSNNVDTSKIEEPKTSEPTQKVVIDPKPESKTENLQSIDNKQPGEKIEKSKEIVQKTSKNINSGIKGALSELSSLFKSLISPQTKKVDLKTTENKDEKIKNNYDLLSNTKTDVKKFFGEDATVGLNGKKISFDKIYKFDDGSIMYQKDGKPVKYICKEYVEIGNTKYYKDGTYVVEKGPSGELDNIINYYSADNILVKKIEKGMGSITTTNYNEDGSYNIEYSSSHNKTVKEYNVNGIIIKESSSDGSYTIYDENGKVIEEKESNGCSTIYNTDGSQISYHSDGKVREIINKDGSIIQYDFDGNKYYEKKTDGSEFVRRNDNSYQINNPDGSVFIYDLYDNGKTRRISTPNGPYDTYYKEYDENGNLIAEKNQYSLVSYKNGKISSFQVEYNGSYGKTYRKITIDDGDYILNLSEDETKILNVVDKNGKVIQNFGSGITYEE